MKRVALLLLLTALFVSCGIVSKRPQYCSRYYRNPNKEFAYPIELDYRPDTCSVCGAKVYEKKPRPISFQAGYFESRKKISMNGTIVASPNMICSNCWQRYSTPRVHKYQAIRVDTLGRSILESFAYQGEVSPNYNPAKYVLQRTFYLVRDGRELSKSCFYDTTSVLIRDTPFNPLYPTEIKASFDDGDWDPQVGRYYNDKEKIEWAVPKELAWAVFLSEEPDIALSILLTGDNDFCMYLDIDSYEDYGNTILSKLEYFNSQEYTEYLKKNLNVYKTQFVSYECSRTELAGLSALRKDLIVNHDYAGIDVVDIHYVLYEVVSNHKLYSLVFRIPQLVYSTNTLFWENRLMELTEGFRMTKE